jgi:CheY-like chemotaxis protein
MSRILLIDDDSLFRSILSATLRHFGHEVIEANDGTEGLQLFAHVNPDLIITDLVMPEMEGFEVLMELRRRSPLVKIVVISGGVRGNTADFLDIAKRFGACAVLAKPFSNDALLSAIEELLPHRGALH